MDWKSLIGKVAASTRGRKKKEKELSESQRNRRLVVELVFKAIFLFMGAVAIIWGIISLIAGSSLFIPRSADGVLDSAHLPTQYRWVSESVRKVNFYGHQEEQAANRSAALNSEKNLFQADIYGVLPQPSLFLSDGVATVRLSQPDVETNRRGDLINDACANFSPSQPSTPDEGDDPAVSSKLLAMPDAKEIIGKQTSIVDSQGTFFGKRAWIINFKPSSKVIEQLLWVPFLDRALSGQQFASERPWIMSEDLRAALRRGDYTVKWARVWVTRDERLLGQYDLRFQVKINKQMSVQYRILAHLYPGEKNVLPQLSLGKNDANNPAKNSFNCGI